MTDPSPTSVRLTPALQAEYQQIYNDPARRHSPEWSVAAKGLVAAGVIQASGGDGGDLDEAVKVAESDTTAQTL